MNLGVIGRTAGLFAVINFATILVVTVAAAFGETFLPEDAIPYLGLLPLMLGIKATVQARKHRRDSNKDEKEGCPRVLEVAAVTFTNGGDHIGSTSRFSPRLTSAS